MQLKKKPDASPDSLHNEPSDSPLVEVAPDSPPVQENRSDVLPQEVVPLKPQWKPDTPHKQQRTFPLWSVVTLLSVLGIGAALIALPSLISGCGSKTKQAEAKEIIRRINRSQQAYHLENKAFSNSLERLDLSIQTPTKNYDYSIRTTKTSAFSYGIARKGTKNIKSYVGGVFLVPANLVEPKASKGEKLTVAISCEAVYPGTTKLAEPTYYKGQLACGEGTRDFLAKK